jgi:outer membrane protein
MSDDPLTNLELAAIALARTERLSSLKPAPCLWRHLFGIRSSTPLANPKLEALRRYAILYRLRGTALPETECERLREVGYSLRQIEMIECLVAPQRQRRQPRARASFRTDASQSPTAPMNFRGAKLVRAALNYLSNTSPRIAVSIAAVAITLWCSAARAQEEGQAPDKDHFVVGTGVGYMPVYQGAEDYRVQPVPVIDISWGPFFANLRNGIGINIIDTDHVTIGGSVAIMPGYRGQDAPDGIGKLSVGAGGRGFVSLRGAGFVATVGVTKGFAGSTKGLIVDASLSRPIFVSSRFTLVPAVAATWADKKHNDRYFGVDAAQSLASGLPEFRAGSGFKDASAMLTAQYRLTDRISLGATGGVTTLLGNVKDSPIVVNKTQPLGFLSLSYRFGP